ncbi:hypothetical protein DF3PA_60105 [Candidatus Defluviicoccus seviourii]|uniref:Uncharacterized protein n=2 Tax=root TaxID=1 RepID=A0A564WGQ9_9PROT|nr:hypothetical protein DF3PA_60105 [Candidatus Defluviicoccus seviourii]
MGWIVMRKKQRIFIRRRQGNRRTVLLATLVLLGLAIWAGTAQDPQLPPIYLKAAPVDTEAGR